MSPPTTGQASANRPGSQLAMDGRRDALRSERVPRCRLQESLTNRTGRAVREGTLHPPECCRGDRRDRCRALYRMRRSAHVSGMICISPMAPLGDLARTSPGAFDVYDGAYPCSGTAKRREASSMKSANGSLVRNSPDVWGLRLACAAVTSTIATKQRHEGQAPPETTQACRRARASPG